jgi:hypothetical protein
MEVLSITDVGHLVKLSLEIHLAFVLSEVR